MTTAPLKDPRPFGLHRAWITGYTDTDGTILSTTSFRLPIARKLSFKVNEDRVTLDGDDKASVASAGKGKTLSGSIEAGGLNIMAWSLITGGQVIEDGVSPNRTKTWRLRGSDQSPYFRIDGQALSNTGGDFVARLYRCVAGSASFDLGYGTFQIPNTDFTGQPMEGDDDDYLFDLIQNETQTYLGSSPAPNPLPIPSNLTLGATTATSVGLTWNELPTADSYVVEQSTDGNTWTAVSSVNGGAPTDASTTVAGLTAATKYYLRVAAVFGADTGEYTSPVVVTTPAS